MDKFLKIVVEMKRFIVPLAVVLAVLAVLAVIYAVPYANLSLASHPASTSSKASAASPVRTILSTVSPSAVDGLVCLAPTTFTTTCPASPPTLSGTLGSTLTVNVIAVNPGSLNTFDISVLADQGVLSAPATSAGVSVSPTFGVVAQVCINGLVVVSSCSSTDGAGVVHVVAGSFSPTSANQVLFSVNYNVVGSSALTTVGYQAGCTATSAPDGTTCVTLVSAITATPLPETPQTALFSNTPPPTFFGGKLSWTHHLSLAKNAGVQTFTAKVTNPSTVNVYVQVVVSGCGDTGSVCFTGSSAPTLFAPGVSMAITFTAPISSIAVGLKFPFVAQIMYGSSATSLPLLSPSTKSGSFAVVA